MFAIIVDFGTSPVILSTGSPFLKTNTLGSPLIEYFFADSMQSSMFTFVNFTLSPYSSATVSITGDNFLQGPHQVAQKSTTTGIDEFITSASKLSSDMSIKIDKITYQY